MARNNFALNVSKEIPNRCLHCFGDSQESLNGNDFFSTLDFSKILGVQISVFRQFLLSEIDLFAVKTNCSTDQFAVAQDGLPFSLEAWHSL